MKAQNFNETKCYIGENCKWGFISNICKTSKDERTHSYDIVLPAQYDDIISAKNNKAQVLLNGETFFINIKGERL